MESLLQDLRYAARMLSKSPAFTAVAVIALALGIGANTAIFSVVNAVLLRPLPLAEPDRLVKINSFNPKGGKIEFGGVSPADFLDYRAEGQSFEYMATYTGGGVTMTGGQHPEGLPGARVSTDYFQMLGVNPMLGRAFSPDEFKSGSAPVIILSHRTWQNRFGGDEELVGKALTLDGESVTVVGVMPPDFNLPKYADVWTPLNEDSSELKNRGNRYFPVIARLKPGASIAQAQADMDRMTTGLAEQHPKSNADWSARVVGLHESMVGDVKPALLVLLAAVCLVLLIACANVANLQLARAAARQKEIAIRSALGASRARVLRQLVTESLLLALAGGVAGTLLALWAVDALIAIMPEALNFPRLDEVRVDRQVLGFTALISLGTGLIFGLIPALQTSRPNLVETLKESSRGAGGARSQRTRSLLVAAEVALTVLLLVGGGLLIRSFALLESVDPGFNPDRVVNMRFGAPMPKYAGDPQRAAFYKETLDRIGEQPEVESVAMNASTPLGFTLAFPFTVEGRESSPDDVPQAAYNSISPNYFRVMGISLVAGRDFSERDDKDAPAAMIINETMARRFFAEADPLGKRIKIDYLGAQISHEIVGVVRDVKQQSLGDKPQVAIYTSCLQRPWFSASLFVRAKNDTGAAGLSAQRAIWSMEPDLPVAGVRPMTDFLSDSVAQPRFYAVLLGAFASVALLLAIVGIYGVVSYSVAQRTREIGVRMALGASSTDVLRLVVGSGVRVAAVGVVAGLAGAFVLTRLMSSLLFDVAPTDPLTFALAPAVLLAVAVAACLIPARRAIKVDPAVALRQE